MPSSGCRPISPGTQKRERQRDRETGDRRDPLGPGRAPGGNAPPEPSRPSGGRLRAQCTAKARPSGQAAKSELKTAFSKNTLSSQSPAVAPRTLRPVCRGARKDWRSTRGTPPRPSLTARQSGCQARSATHSAHPSSPGHYSATVPTEPVMKSRRRRLCPHSPRIHFPAQVPPESHRST